MTHATPHDTAEARLQEVAAAFADRPGVVQPSDGPRHFGTATLRLGRSIVAMTPGDHLVVKLPAHRVTALVEAGEGLPFPEGRPPMREWVAIASDDPTVWHDRVAEALEHVGR